MIRFIVCCLAVGIATSQARAQGETDVRPAFSGEYATQYEQFIAQLDTGMRLGAVRIFDDLKQKAMAEQADARELELDLDRDTAPFDAFLDCQARPETIVIPKELRLTAYRLAQASAAVAMLPKGKTDKTTALGDYTALLARAYVSRVIEKDPTSLAGRVPEPSEFLSLDRTDLAYLNRTEQFAQEADAQWQITMQALLAHEMGHALLGHCKTTVRDVAVEQAADERARKLLSANGDVFAPELVQQFLLDYLYYSRFARREDVASLCFRLIDELRSSLLDTRSKARKNPDINLIMKKRMGVDLAQLTDSDVDQIANGSRAQCSRYNGLK